jgi:hypothetical protein
MDAGGGDYHRGRWTARLLARFSFPRRGGKGSAVIPVVGKVRFHQPYRPPQVRWGVTGVIVDTEERPTLHGHRAWIRARFGDFIKAWIEAGQLEPVS